MEMGFVRLELGGTERIINIHQIVQLYKTADGWYLGLADGSLIPIAKTEIRALLQVLGAP